MTSFYESPEVSQNQMNGSIMKESPGLKRRGSKLGCQEKQTIQIKLFALEELLESTLTDGKNRQNNNLTIVKEIESNKSQDTQTPTLDG